MTTKLFNVTGMACKHCAAKVSAKASSLNGVKSVEVDLDGKKMTATFDETVVSAEAIAAAVTAGGFPTTVA